MPPNGAPRGHRAEIGGEIGAEGKIEGADAPAPDSGEGRSGDDGSARESRRGQPTREQSKPRFDGQRDRRDGGARNRSNDPERRGRGGDRAPAEKKSFEKKSFERPPDPNSPFAKLLVLKASLEEKNKKDR